MPRLVEIYNAISPEPVTVERWIAWESSPAEGRIREWVVGVNADGYIVGYAGAEHVPWMAEGHFGCYSRVDPAYRNQGVGEAQLRHVEGWAVAHGARHFRCGVREDHLESIAFAEKRGYSIERHIFDSTLDLASFDESRFAGTIEAAEAAGFSFRSLAEGTSEALERKVYAVMRESVLDIPGNEDPGFEPFEEWRREFPEPGTDPAWYLYAMHGDEVAGLTYMHLIPETGAMWTQYTGVGRAFRGHKLALALKLLSVRVARQFGATYMRTNNDSKNAPMLAVNRKMGYQPSPGQYRMVKRI